MLEALNILDHAKKGDVQPIYFLAGDEPYYIDLISNYFEKEFLPEAERDFNQTVLYGKDTTPEQLLETVKRFPMMAEKQLVVLKEAQTLRGLDKLDPYIQNPSRSTVLVICHKYKKLDMRTSFGKSVKKNTTFLESKKIYDNQLPDWIQSLAKSKDLKISPKATMMLSEYIGNDLNRIAGEVEKLEINLEQGEEISDEHIERYIGISKDYNVFEFVNSINRREAEKVFRIVSYFQANPKDHPLVVVLSVLYNHFSKLLSVHYMTDRSVKHIQNQLKTNIFVARELNSGVKMYSGRQCARVISLLREYDLKSKGVGNVSIKEGELLKELTARILQ